MPSPSPENLLVLGANGRTGRLVLDAALTEGHSVTAVVRAADRLHDVQHERLVVKVGSPCDEAFLERVMPGHDAVISALGPRWPTSAAASVYPDSASAIVAAMGSAGVERLLVTSSALLFPDESWLNRALRWGVPAIVANARDMEGHIRSSVLDWTIARTGFLTNADTTAHRVGEHALPDGGTSVSRAALARFLLSEVDQARFSRKVVGVGGCR